MFELRCQGNLVRRSRDEDEVISVLWEIIGSCFYLGDPESLMIEAMCQDGTPVKFGDYTLLYVGGS